MAITPNTTFSSATLSSTQLNNFPRGVMTLTTNVTSAAAFSAETIQITSPSFTAVANRNYKITYFDPTLIGSAASTATLRLRLTNVTGTILQQSNATINVVGNSNAGHCVGIVTLTAGATVIVATLQANAGTVTPTRGATNFAFLSIEDIGTA